MTVIRLLVRQQQAVRERIAELHFDETPGIEIVGEVHDVFDVLILIKHKQADVVVASESSEDRGMASQLFAEFPDMTVLLLGPGGKVHIEQRCRYRWTATDQSGEAIVKALRIALENPCDLQNDAVG